MHFMILWNLVQESYHILYENGDRHNFFTDNF